MRKLIVDTVREFFLRHRALNVAGARSADQQVRLRRLCDAADARLSLVECLNEGNSAAPAVVLLRDATILAIRAIFEARGIVSSDWTVDEAYHELALLLEGSPLPGKPDTFEQVRDLLTDRRNLAFDELSATDGIARRAEVEVTTRWLRRQVDPRTVAQIKHGRLRRLVTLGGALVAGLAWGGARLVKPRDLALTKPVQVSSRRPDCPSGSGASGLPPSGLVDGSKSHSYDICTNMEVRPWVTIDLEGVYSVSRVVVYNRGDCCWGGNDLPVVLEFSADRTNFVEVGRRTTAYTSQDPWVVPAGGRRAALVRLRVDADAPRELVLNEVEVFAE